MASLKFCPQSLEIASLTRYVTEISATTAETAKIAKGTAAMAPEPETAAIT
ncbi:hypothetical protein [Wolbachia endosymbiont (group A) of Trypoxylon clavicerum]|uniref:hypothetical protein n=1 Tax=Wolbachia endosymbiont (group A) of Trypoxylon clavicerum TaxID=2954064 RepID=UPI002230EB42|nr:hypothetical protein [Wolbachia endosymbiont (group A) of Trypoxylon clavicerum]